ncbi:hypothetical protein [Mesorhizobium sp. B3-1-9]|uniref:hypothetical protein n=1 Tax=Mesorhizobium sp. B3-1-9 TaxID=2589892 RepID=UPI0015E42CF3|nr:hypothetical protein [Mesorhizobium sp. B3-1-9]
MVDALELTAPATAVPMAPADAPMTVDGLLTKEIVAVGTLARSKALSTIGKSTAAPG